MFNRVFVTVGTTSFQELIQLVVSEEAVSQFVKLGVQEVRIQGGKNSIDRDSDKWTEKGIKFHLYDYKTSIVDDMKWADLIICHAGAGTTIEALDLGKVIIVVPNETLMDNHQMELAEKLAKENYAFQATIGTFFQRLLDVNEDNIRPFPPARPESLNEYLNTVTFRNDLLMKQK